MLFETEEKEYEYINKFGRGAWEYGRLQKTFNQQSIDIIVKLAHEYGAFDY